MGLKKGQLAARLSILATRVHTTHESYCPDIGPICRERDEPPQVHDQRFTVAELRASVEYGLTEALGVEVQVPARLSATTVQFRALDGTLLDLDYANIHHRDETLLGLGDPWVLGRHAFTLGELRLAARAGVSLPLGTTVENPFALGEAGQEHQHVQFGSGTVQPLLGLELARAWTSFSAHAWAHAQLSLAENHHGYRSGHRLALGMSGEAPLGAGLSASVGADVAHETPERWDGRVQQEGNLGRTDVLVGGGLHWGVGEARLGLTLRVPVYTHLTGHHGQLDYPGLLTFSVDTPFGG